MSAGGDGEGRTFFLVGMASGAIVLSLLIFLVGFIRTIIGILWNSSVAVAGWASQAIFVVLNVFLVLLWVAGSVVVAACALALLLKIIIRMGNDLDEVVAILRRLDAPKPTTSMPIVFAGVVQCLIIVLTNSVASTQLKIVLTIFVWSFATVLALSASRATRHKLFGVILLADMLIFLAIYLWYCHGVGGPGDLAALVGRARGHLQQGPATDMLAAVMICFFVISMPVASVLYGWAGRVERATPPP